MDRIDLVIFDMDGLLIDSERGMWLVSEKKSIEELGYPFSYDFAVSLMGTSTQEYKKRIIECYGKDFPFDEYHKKIIDNNNRIINNNEIKLMKGVIELLDFLKENNIQTKIATSTNKTLAIKMLNNLKIYDYFYEIITGDEVQNGKPNPDIYIKAMDNTDNNNVLIFEDSHNGARAAISSGGRLVLVPDIARVDDKDKMEADYVIDSLEKGINIIKQINNIK